MSTQPLPSPDSTMSSAVARVAQIEQMLAQAANGFNTTLPTSGGGTSASPTNFSTVLASAASAAGSPSSSSSGSEYAPIIDAAASAYGLDPAVLTGLIQQESGFNPQAVSSAGAEGLTQVMPENFAADGITNPFDPTQSIFGGAKQLSEDLSEFGGNYTDALAAYNAGVGAVQQYGGVPPYAQTQSYVTNVLSDAQQYAQQQAATPATTAATGQGTGAGVP
jgi:soluble lytic murein transglycosylase-like protein